MWELEFIRSGERERERERERYRAAKCQKDNEGNKRHLKRYSVLATCTRGRWRAEGKKHCDTP